MDLRAVILAMVVVVAAGPALAAPVGAQAGQSDLTHPSHDEEGGDACTFPYTVEDATPQRAGGPQDVTVEQEPQEVVVLAPNVAQHMWEIGAEDKVVGMPVNDNTAYLPGSEDRTHVLQETDRGFSEPNTERIVEMQPDLVLSPNVTPGDAVKELRDAGLTVYHYPVATNFSDVMTLVERTGRLVGACDAAKERTEAMADQIALVEQATQGVEEPTVFYDLSQEQAETLYTVNSKAFEHNLLDIAGAENVAADVEGQYGSGYPPINQETVLEANPDIVVSPGPLTDFAQTRLVDQADARAIQIDADFISQHAPRTVDVLEALAEELHPEAMEQARTDESSEESSGEQRDTEDDEEIIQDQQNENASESADDGGPGFAVGAAVAGLLALALVATRRR